MPTASNDDQIDESIVSPGIASIGLGKAIATWAAGWVAGMLIVGPLVVVALGAELGDDLTIPEIVAATAAAWGVFLVALAVASRRFGTADPVADYALRFRVTDLLWVPLGPVTQLVLIPLLYWPLQIWWPETFSDEQLGQRAQDLVDQAGGINTVFLILLVVVGAPIIEELVYRGLLQRSMSLVIGAVPALVVTALWFALIHPVPIEYPGLMLAGLTFGAGVVVTKRLGPGIITHAAFNATGLIMVFR